MFKSKIPKNDGRFVWTNHVIGKMMFYGLSAQKVRSVIAGHKRREEGIAPNTVAVMCPAGSKKRPTEIWVMYRIIISNPKSQNSKMPIPERRKKIISAWRYPGISPKGKEIFIPDDVWAELGEQDSI